MIEDELELSVDDLAMDTLHLAEAIKEFGAQELWKQLKAGFPSQYNEMLYYALDQLKK